MDNQFVGLCIPSKLYKEFPHNTCNEEEIYSLYEAGAEQYGLKLCYFRWEDYEPGAENIDAFVKEESGYQIRSVKIPKIIINRTMTNSKKCTDKITELKTAGKKIFNAYIKDSKYSIHKILKSDPELKKHLPKTKKASKSRLYKMMRKYDKLIIKPKRGSLGIGIMVLEKEKKGKWSLTYQTDFKGSMNTVTFNHTVQDTLLQAIKNHSYIIQKYIPLATHEGRPFDIRVHLQRDETGAWGMTGLFAKVAPQHHFLTNVGQGGIPYPLERLIGDERYPTVYQEINKLAFKTAIKLEEHLPHIAELGLDIGITEDGFPYFIECNFRPHRYMFKLANLTEEWRQTYINPLAYARFLLNQNDAMEENDYFA